MPPAPIVPPSVARHVPGCGSGTGYQLPGAGCETGRYKDCPECRSSILVDFAVLVDGRIYWIGRWVLISGCAGIRPRTFSYLRINGVA
ncbi:hypothetical protein QF001_001538 [Paraburkholderia youngii]